MAAPRLIQVYSSFCASPYAHELFLLGDEALLDAYAGAAEVSIEGVAIDATSHGKRHYWRLAPGGEFTLIRVPPGIVFEKSAIRVPGGIQFEGYKRQPVDGLRYLPVLPGEVWPGRLQTGKNRTMAFYAATLCEKGLVLVATDHERWGDRAHDDAAHLLR